MIGHGSHGLMLTTKGAMAVHDAMTSGQVPRGDIDLVLLPWLREETVARTVGACYRYPSLGSFWEHVSGCDPVNYGEAQGGRPSGFDKGGPAPGTRVATAPKKRQTYMSQWQRPNGEREWTPFSEREEVA